VIKIQSEMIFPAVIVLTILIAEVNLQNCAIPRIVTFTDNGEDEFKALTETAQVGDLLLKIPTRNILSARNILSYPK
jgi:type II secretory pathway component PulF